MILTNINPAIEAGKEFLKKIGREEYGSQLIAVIMSHFPGMDRDDDWFFPISNYYANVLIPHKVEVWKAGLMLYDAGAVDKYRFSEDQNRKIWEYRLIVHDASKFSEAEEGYSCYRQDEMGFMRIIGSGDVHDAWCHHQGANHHHPESCYRLNRAGELQDVHPMDYNNVAEMVADWIGAQKSYGNPDGDWLDYVKKNLDQWRWNNKTLDRLRKILMKIGIVFYFKWLPAKDGLNRIMVEHLYRTN